MPAFPLNRRRRASENFAGNVSPLSARVQVVVNAKPHLQRFAARLVGDENAAFVRAHLGRSIGKENGHRGALSAVAARRDPTPPSMHDTGKGFPQ